MAPVADLVDSPGIQVLSVAMLRARPANPSLHRGRSAILYPPIKEVHDGTEDIEVVESTGPIVAEACSAMAEKTA